MLLNCYYEHPCNPHNIVLAVKGCLGIFFMVFKVGLKLLVLLKGACFAVVVRLQICEAIWIGYTSQKSVFSPWGFIHD